jgi:hypothetical protein
MEAQTKIKTDPVDRPTVLCLRRKNQPRVFVVVCEKCRYRFKCASYQQYISPGLFDVKRKGRVGKKK